MCLWLYIHWREALTGVDFSDPPDGGNRAGDHQTGGERGSRLLGKTVAASLRAATRGPGEQTG